MKIDLRHGFKQYAKYTEAIYKGCWNNCRYCFVRFNYCIRGIPEKRKWDDWKWMSLNKPKYSKGFRKREGITEFPNSHDIFPFNKRICFNYLKKILTPQYSGSGLNQLLIVSKPRLKVFEAFNKEFEEFKSMTTDKQESLIDLRLTLTTQNETLLRFWEENASFFQERLETLKFLYEQGWQTSCSIEPYLGPPQDVMEIVDEISPYVTNVIWIGFMTKIKRKGLTKEEKPFYEKIRKYRNEKNIFKIIDGLKNNKKVLYKSQIIRKEKYRSKIPKYQLPIK